MVKPENCEIIEQTHSKKQNSEPSFSNENKDSTKQATESSIFPAVFKILARNKPILDVLSVTCLIMVFASIGLVVCFVVGKSSSKTSNNNNDNNLTRIVPRSEWLAQPPKETVNMLQLPVHNVIVAHTATDGCTTQYQCAAMVNRIQSFHMNTIFFSDILFNFLVGADGNVYEGRGWDRQGAHTKGFNKDSICIAFIGTFTEKEALQPQLDAVRRLIALGVEQGMVDPHYRLYGQRQLAPTESPGKTLFEHIKTWPNWSSELGPRHY